MKETKNNYHISNTIKNKKDIFKNLRSTKSEDLKDILESQIKNPRLIKLIEDKIRHLEKNASYKILDQRAGDFFDEGLRFKKILFFLGKDFKKEFTNEKASKEIERAMQSFEYKEAIKQQFLEKYRNLFIKKTKDIFSKNQSDFSLRFMQFADEIFSFFQVGYESEIANSINKKAGISDKFMHTKIKKTLTSEDSTNSHLLSHTPNNLAKDVSNIMTFLGTHQFGFFSKKDLEKEISFLFQNPMQRKKLIQQLNKPQTLEPIYKGNDIYTLELHQSLGWRMILQKIGNTYYIDSIFTDHQKYEKKLRFLEANRKIELSKRKKNNSF